MKTIETKDIVGHSTQYTINNARVEAAPDTAIRQLIARLHNAMLAHTVEDAIRTINAREEYSTYIREAYAMTDKVAAVEYIVNNM